MLRHCLWVFISVIAVGVHWNPNDTKFQNFVIRYHWCCREDGLKGFLRLHLLQFPHKIHRECSKCSQYYKYHCQFHYFQFSREIQLFIKVSAILKWHSVILLGQRSPRTETNFLYYLLKFGLYLNCLGDIPVDLGCKIHRLQFCKGVRPSPN